LEVSRDPDVVTDRIVRLISRANPLLERAKADVQAAAARAAAGPQAPAPPAAISLKPSQR